MKIAGFGVEEWLNKWEKSATYRHLSKHNFVDDHARGFSTRRPSGSRVL